MTHHVLIVHEVEHYETWKVVFDRTASIRTKAGEIGYRLLRLDTSTNHVMHFSARVSLDRARAFFESPDLIEIRHKAGVRATTFLYLDEIEHGSL